MTSLETSDYYALVVYWGSVVLLVFMLVVTPLAQSRQVHRMEGIAHEITQVSVRHLA